MTELLSGKPVAEAIKQDILGRVENLKAHDTVPALAIIRIGANKDDITYENSLMKVAQSLGIAVESISFEETVCEADLIDAVRAVNDNAAIHGCLMFRPLPKGIDEFQVCNTLDPAKDVDGMTSLSLAGIFMGTSEGYPCATAEACIRLLDFYNIDVASKQVVVIGRSLVIGKPVAMLALNRDATVTLCHSKSADLADIVRRADIVICATGRARAFGKCYFDAGQTVIDVGTNISDDGDLCGDVDLGEVYGNIAYVTPVPGGVGSVTTAVLLDHVVASAERACRKV